MKTLLKNGRVVSSSNKIDDILDILIEDNVIAQMRIRSLTAPDLR